MSRLILRDAVGDPAAVHLELLLARAPGADPGALLGQAEPLAAQARQAVAQLGQLDLELAFVRPGPLGEDVEDELGPVDDLDLDLVLEVPLLGRVEGVVEDDEVGRSLARLAGDVGDLALADEPAGVEARPDLEDLPGDLGPGRRGQAGQLGHGFLGLFLFGPGRGHVDEYCAFHGIPRPYCNWFWTYCSRAGAVLGGEPDDPGHLPEPGHLPLGVLPRLDLGQRDGLVAPDLAAEEPEDMAVSEGPEGRGRLRDAPLEEAPDLVDEAAGEHPLDAVLDAPAERLALEPEAETENGPARDRRAGLAEVLGDGPSGRRVDLEGADDADAVPAADLPGVFRIDRLEPAEQGLEPLLPRFGLERRPHRRVAAGAGKEAVREGFEIEAGAAGDDRQPSPGGDPPGGLERVPDEIGGRDTGPPARRCR